MRRARLLCVVGITTLASIPTGVAAFDLRKRIAMVHLPEKGVGLVALEPIAQGEVIARWFPRDSRTIERVVGSLDAFERELHALDDRERRVVLNHSWPTPAGRIVVGARDAVFGCVNHSSPPNVLHSFGAAAWTTTAHTALDAGDELCYDYNLGSKYEIRTDEAMLGFLSLCDLHGVQKRPSLGMTRPPCRVSKKDLLRATPLSSAMPPREDNGATGCTLWI